VVIAALMVIYGWIRARRSIVHIDAAGRRAASVLVILIRRFLPADQLARAQDVFELVADGVTVLCFALGVYGGIARIPEGV
jgi:hypothetical protein